MYSVCRAAEGTTAKPPLSVSCLAALTLLRCILCPRQCEHPWLHSHTHLRHCQPSSLAALCLPGLFICMAGMQRRVSNVQAGSQAKPRDS